jgi:hypothetical protein
MYLVPTNMRAADPCFRNKQCLQEQLWGKEHMLGRIVLSRFQDNLAITQIRFIPRSLEHAILTAEKPSKTSQTPLPSSHRPSFPNSFPTLQSAPHPPAAATRQQPTLHQAGTTPHPSPSRTFSMLLSRRFSCALARAPSLVRGRPLPPRATPVSAPASRLPPGRLMSSSSAGWQQASRPPPPPPPPPHPGAEKVLENTLTLCLSAPISMT